MPTARSIRLSIRRAAVFRRELFKALFSCRTAKFSPAVHSAAALFSAAAIRSECSIPTARSMLRSDSRRRQSAVCGRLPCSRTGKFWSAETSRARAAAHSVRYSDLTPTARLTRVSARVRRFPFLQTLRSIQSSSSRTAKFYSPVETSATAAHFRRMSCG